MKAAGLIIFSIFFTLMGVAQSLFPMGDTAEWSQRSYAYSGPYSGGESGFLLRVTGDTIINSHTYRALWVANTYSVTLFDYGNGIHVVLVNNYPEPYQFSFAGGFRTDSTKKVYFYNAHPDLTFPCSNIPIGQEKMIYDFSLTPGDTFHVDQYTKMVVDSVDTLLLGDYSRKRLFFNSRPWIEGIGDYYALLGQDIGVESGCQTSCFKENGKYIYTNPALYQSDTAFCNKTHKKTQMPDGVETLEDDFGVLLQGRKLRVTSTDGCDFQLYNIAGQPVLFEKIFPSDPTEVDLSQLPPGLFLYSIMIDGKKRYSGKLLLP